MVLRTCVSSSSDSTENFATLSRRRREPSRGKKNSGFKIGLREHHHHHHRVPRSLCSLLGGLDGSIDGMDQSPWKEHPALEWKSSDARDIQARCAAAFDMDQWTGKMIPPTDASAVLSSLDTARTSVPPSPTTLSAWSDDDTEACNWSNDLLGLSRNSARISDYSGGGKVMWGSSSTPSLSHARPLLDNKRSIAGGDPIILAKRSSALAAAMRSYAKGQVSSSCSESPRAGYAVASSGLIVDATVGASVPNVDGPREIEVCRVGTAPPGPRRRREMHDLVHRQLAFCTLRERQTSPRNSAEQSQLLSYSILSLGRGKRPPSALENSFLGTASWA
jgi:hypothetical protein